MLLESPEPGMKCFQMPLNLSVKGKLKMYQGYMLKQYGHVTHCIKLFYGLCCLQKSHVLMIPTHWHYNYSYGTFYHKTLQLSIYLYSSSVGWDYDIYYFVPST